MANQLLIDAMTAGDTRKQKLAREMTHRYHGVNPLNSAVSWESTHSPAERVGAFLVDMMAGGDSEREHYNRIRQDYTSPQADAIDPAFMGMDTLTSALVPKVAGAYTNYAIKNLPEISERTTRAMSGDLVGMNPVTNIMAGQQANMPRGHKTRLKEARQMHAAGQSPEEIWQKTGWNQNVAGQWRYEIEDNLSKLADEITDGEYIGHLEDILKHDDLYNQYPHLKKLGIRIKLDPNVKHATGEATTQGKALGSLYNPATKESLPYRITATAGSKDDLTDTILHEVQHHIQKYENFPRGGNASDMARWAKSQRIENDLIETGLKQMEDEYGIPMDARWDDQALQSAWEKLGIGKNNPARKEYEMYRKDWDELHSKNPLLMVEKDFGEEFDGEDFYMNLAGEIESRAVESRRHMPSHQLKSTAPIQTEMTDKYAMDPVVRFDDVLSDMTYYHGSPHKFSKFSLDNIGTGEGAQAYGHGLYFAEDPNVAGHYSTLGWYDVSKLNAQDEKRFRYLFGGRTIEAARKDSKKNLKFHQDRLNRYGDDMSASAREDAAYQIEREQRDLADMDYLESKVEKNDSYMYEVDIPDEHVMNFLDWDAPLSEQPEFVQKAIRESPIGKEYADSPNMFSDFNGAQIYTRLVDSAEDGAALPGVLAQEADNAPEAVSKYLNALGIKGIRYLDGNSRQLAGISARPTIGPAVGGGFDVVAPDGRNLGKFETAAEAEQFANNQPRKQLEGTRNIVVFDDSIINATHRNQQPIVDAMQKAIDEDDPQKIIDLINEQ